MSSTDIDSTEKSAKAKKDSGELSAMTVTELKKVAGALGIDGAAKLSKGDLVSSIADLQAANREAAKQEREEKRLARQEARNKKNSGSAKGRSEGADNDSDESEDSSPRGGNDDRGGNDRNDRNDRGNNDRRDRNDRGGNDRNDRGDRGRGRDRSRFRDRGDRPERGEREIQISEDDVLLPVAGLLDILDSYAFIRTTGYLAGPNDVYVSLQQVRRYGLRNGDVITGQVRQPHEG